MASPYQDGKHWAVRLRIKGQDIYLGGFPTAAAARQAAELERQTLERAGLPAHGGPRRTSLAQAFQDYALERLPYLKGGRQDAERINRYLRAAGCRDMIHVESVPAQAGQARVLFWRISLTKEAGRRMPESLKPHRSRQDQRHAKSTQLQGRLARTSMAEVTPYMIQQYLNAMMEEGYAPASISLERAELRRLFNYTRRIWNWPQPLQNPACLVTLPRVDNQRDRVLTNAEWRRMVPLLAHYGNPYALPALTLLLETAMRSSEPLLYAVWSGVDWERCLLRLTDAKTGPRDVPLNPAAMGVLEELRARAGTVGHGDRILPTSYEALKKAWRVVCEQAGIEAARLYDLRHTGATRYAMQFNGNLPLLRLITGHKTFSQLRRYIHLKPADVSCMMHGRPLDPDSAPAGLSLPAAPVAAARLDGGLPGNVIAFPGRRSA